MPLQHPQRRAAASSFSVGRIKLPDIPSMPERLVKIAPELADYDRGVRAAFEALSRKVNTIEEMLRSRVDGT